MKATYRDAQGNETDLAGSIVLNQAQRDAIAAVPDKLDKASIGTPGAGGVAGYDDVQAKLGTKVAKGDLVVNVKDAPYNAKGDGTTDDTAAINAALTASSNVTFPVGTYLISGNLNVVRNNQTITLSRGVTMKPTTSSTVFRCNGYSGLTLDGNGATVDLNAVCNYGVSVSGNATTTRTDINIRNLVIKNRPRLLGIKAGFGVGLSYVSRATVENVTVLDFAFENIAGEECYAFFATNSSAVKFDKCNVQNGYIGFDIDTCSDVQISGFSIKTLTDNGVYCLSGSTGISITRGSIDAAEEGIVIYPDDVRVDDVRITNCTNKGVTFRAGSLAKIRNCHFEGNAIGICDNGDSVPITHALMGGNTFKNNLNRAIYLISLQDSDILNNHFLENVITAQNPIRFNNAKRVNFDWNTVENTGKTNANALVRFSVASDHCQVRNNTFTDAALAIDLFTSGSGPSNTYVAENKMISVTTPYATSAGLTNNRYVPQDSNNSLKGRTVTAATTMLNEDQVVVINSATAVSQPFLAANTVTAYRVYTFVSTGGGTTTFTATISGTANRTVTNGVINVLSNGSEWLLAA